MRRGVTAALAIAAIFGAATIPGCGRGDPIDERVGSAASAIQGGDVDAAHPFAVGVCGVAAGPGQCQLVCSGTLIAPNLVVTARHCVDDSTSQTDCATATWSGHRYTSADQYYVTTSKDLYQATTGWHRVAAIRTPETTSLCGADLALLILQDTVASTEATPATPAIAYPLTDRAHYPSLAETAIGYGITQPGTNTEGTRHIRTGVAIQCIPGDTAIDCDPKLAFAGSAGEFLVGDATCDGDSGGGAFEQAAFTAGSFVVLGALSRGGVSVDGKSCIGGVYTRFDGWRSFIAGVGVEAAQRGAYPSPAWTTLPADAGAADAAPDANTSPSTPSTHGCAVVRYSSVPYQPFALGMLLWCLRRWNCTRKRTQFRRAVGKKTGYC